MNNSQILLVLSPLIVIDLALLIFALRDLIRRPAAAVVGNNKWLWLAIILLISFGSILYLWLGRKEPPVTDE
jgi:Phospholipase_D-nuclease N-terminal